MKHRHLVGQRWSLAAIDDCLGEHGSLRDWRGLMRAVWADPYGPIAAGVERMLDAREPRLAEPYEGGITEETYWLWRAASYGLPSIRFHDLRRFAAVLLLTGSGGDVMSAGAALGHSRKSRLAADVYGYLPPEIARRLADGAEAALWTVDPAVGYPESSSSDRPARVHRSSDRSSRRHLVTDVEPESSTKADIAQR